MPPPSNFDPQSNPLATQNLEQTYLVAADNFVLSQLYANVIRAQHELDSTQLDAGLATAIYAYQARMKTIANLVSDRLIDGFLKTTNNGFNFAGLVIPCFDEGLPADAVSDITDEAGKIVVAANSLNMNYQQGEKAIEGYGAPYDEQLTEAISRLSESAKHASSEIDALQNAISKNLEDIVKGGQETGQAITNLTYTVLTKIAGAINDTRRPKDKPKLAHDSDDEDQREDKPDADDEDPKNSDSLPDSASSSDFTVSAIQAGSAGVTTLSAAMQELNTNNEKLAKAYQKLAQENALITVAKVMQVQNKMFLKAFGQLGQSTSNLTKEWKAVESAYSTLGQQLRSGNDQADLNGRVAGAKALWNALSDQLKYTRTLVTGVR